ncbi:dienelactone hydrolase family protein [Methylocapsa sp. S129]|uniref:dienelactone hydrolase family protein n=1 Tax=Methylocapsa sp. S129 TaxID=1641869 RepID=UPI00131A7C42|nr:dienelactone hydrolase family protein [Methylocapsa sp. S129]
MGEHITLKASDGVEIGAWRADPAGAPRGAIVVIQEIMGVNHHIRAIADLYASHGYVAIAPALFDRAEPGVELGYDGPSIQRGMALAGKLDRANMLLDVAAAIERVKSAGKVGIVGYCLGGTVAYLAACKLPGLSAASCYYGGGVLAVKDESPRIPTILHFGSKDAHIPVAGVKEFETAHPDLPVYVYDADHGFNCDERGSYDAPSAALARARTLDFFKQKVG